MNIYKGLIVILLGMLLMGCQNQILSIQDLGLTEALVHELDLKSMESLIIELDASVLGLSIVSTSDETLHFSQKANLQELLLQMDTSTEGRVTTVSFSNTPQKTQIGSKNSEATLKIPKDIPTSLHITINVGNISSDTTDFNLTQAHLNTKVGDVSLKTKHNQASLEDLFIQTNVGAIEVQLAGADQLASIELDAKVNNIYMVLNGHYPALSGIHIETGTGDITSHYSGVFPQALTLHAQNKVGSSEHVFSGVYESGIKGHIKSDVGGIKLGFTDHYPLSLDVKANKPTSKFVSHQLDFSNTNQSWLFKGQEGLEFLTFDVSANVGDVVVTKVKEAH